MKVLDDCNDIMEFQKLKPEEQKILLNWILENIRQIRSYNGRHTSYGMKHIFSSSEHGFYIVNGAFKGAMIECGFKVKDRSALNWVFNVSEKSPCFRRCR